MKNPLPLILIILTSFALKAQQPDYIIQFNGGCTGTIDAPGTWAIDPSHITSCINGAGYRVVTINKYQENCEGLNGLGPNSNTQFGVLCTGSHT
jgi:hypothetical protein